MQSVKKRELGASVGHSWAALSGPRGSITRGQCLVSLSGQSSHTQTHTRAQQAHLLWRVFHWLRFAVHPSKVAFVSLRWRNRGTLWALRVAQQRRKTQRGERVMWELKDSIQCSLKSHLGWSGGGGTVMNIHQWWKHVCKGETEGGTQMEVFCELGQPF